MKKKSNRLSTRGGEAPSRNVCFFAFIVEGSIFYKAYKTAIKYQFKNLIRTTVIDIQFSHLTRTK